MREPPIEPGAVRTRREFLEEASALGAGLIAATSAAPAGAAEEEKSPATSLPAIPLGRHRISRLILGGNPIYGYSHFNHLYDRHMREYHTPERVVDLLRAATRAGIRAWQNSYETRTVEDVRRVREAGIEFDWLLLGKPGWVDEPSMVETAAREKPIGIAPHGAMAERLHRSGEVPVLIDFLKRIRATGVLVGLSAHDPALIALSEKEGWDVDYYMCCLHYLTRPAEEYAKILGERPLGEIYLPSDRTRMLEVVAKAKKPCLVYKVLAAGRRDLSPGGIRGAFQEVLRAVKPSDGMIVGMFQEFGDQVGTNAALVRELCAV